VEWDQEYKSLKNRSDLMPINVTVTNSGMILQQELLIMKNYVFFNYVGNGKVFVWDRGVGLPKHGDGCDVLVS